MFAIQRNKHIHTQIVDIQAFNEQTQSVYQIEQLN